MFKVMVFCRFQENLEINMEKKIMDTATKTEIDAAKTASKRVVQKTAEKKYETNELEEIHVPPEERQQIIDDLRLF